MIAYQQIETTSCETAYRVLFNGEVYHVNLWIIVGGTPAIAFDDCGAITRRFVPTPEVQEKWSGWENGRFPHQKTSPIQGPTPDVLPNGADDLEQFLIDCLPQMREEKKKQAKQAAFKKAGIKPPTGPPREPHESAEISARTTGRDILRALRGKGRGVCQIRMGGQAIIISLKLVREMARIYKGDILALSLAPDGLRIDRPMGHSIFRNGAGDKYIGLHGYDVEVSMLT